MEREKVTIQRQLDAYRADGQRKESDFTAQVLNLTNKMRELC